MTANQSTVKSDMATVDYGSFQSTGPLCLRSNCLSYPKNRKKEERQGFFPPQLVQISYALGSNVYKARVPLMARLGEVTLNQKTPCSERVYSSRSKIKNVSWDDEVQWIQVGNNRKRKFTHPMGSTVAEQRGAQHHQNAALRHTNGTPPLKQALNVSMQPHRGEKRSSRANRYRVKKKEAESGNGNAVTVK